jgi:hypothetical protein
MVVSECGCLQGQTRRKVAGLHVGRLSPFPQPSPSSYQATHALCLHGTLNGAILQPDAHQPVPHTGTIRAQLSLPDRRLIGAVIQAPR